MDKSESQPPIIDIIAENLKNLRQEKKLSLDNVSELTGVSKSMLGQIERCESSPTISTLWKIATGLHISFTALMEAPRAEATVVHKDDLKPIIIEDGHFRLYPMFSCSKSRNFEILYIEIDPHTESYSLPHDPGTEEFITVYSGVMEIQLGDAAGHVIPSGASISFKADQPHTYKNTTDHPVRLSMVIFYKYMPVLAV